MTEDTSRANAPIEPPATPPPTPSAKPDLWSQIKEHKMLQWAVAYLSAAFVIAQAQQVIREAFDAALRKVDDMAYKTGARTKLERGRRRPRTGASAEA